MVATTAPGTVATGQVGDVTGDAATIAAMIMIGFATADAIIAFLMFYVPITSPTSASTPDGLNDYLAMSNTLQIFHASIFCAIVILQDCMLVRNIYRGQ